ncbi:MAG: ABC transporter permease subunit [Deinococcus-Thermus bacterium]|jgi:peptide/nickel transport system permease protein|nr:ABC transporter permease subunit [Deinococcota bacterium]
MTDTVEQPPVAGAPAPEARVVPKVESPWRRIAAEFVESRLALAGLAVLLVIVFVAVFAPVLAPQDPYDLSEIDVNDARLPPGAAELSPAPEQEFVVAVDPAADTADVTAGAADVPLVETVGVRLEAQGDGVWQVTLLPEPADAFAALEEVRIDGLPRGAELTVGEKHSFRSFWEVPTDALPSFGVVLPEGTAEPFELEIDVTGTERQVLNTYWLGTDGQGRDMLSAIMYGLRTSLSVGVLSGIFALVIGMSMGLTAAYFGGRVDNVIMRVVDLQLSFPAILVALMLLAALGRGVDKVILALIVVQWAYYARTARSAALVEAGREYIEAARCLALSTPRIIFRHLLPNCLPPVIVVGTVQVANAIALEATLSFLGIGLPVTEPSLGLLISNGFDFLLSGRYWISFFPGVALLVTIVAINLVGDQLRDVLNPRLKR